MSTQLYPDPYVFSAIDHKSSSFCTVYDLASVFIELVLAGLLMSEGVGNGCLTYEGVGIIIRSPILMFLGSFI